MIQHRAKVDFQTFFEFTLLKENMVTDDQVKSIKKSWEMMNADGDTYISLVPAAFQRPSVPRFPMCWRRLTLCCGAGTRLAHQLAAH